MTAVQKAMAELQTAIQTKDTPADTLKAKLEAFRAAKTTAKADLQKAQDDLKSVLTQRQEAVLVVNSIVE
jgi:chromosome segregation ATPase